MQGKKTEELTTRRRNEEYDTFRNLVRLLRNLVRLLRNQGKSRQKSLEIRLHVRNHNLSRNLFKNTCEILNILNANEILKYIYKYNLNCLINDHLLTYKGFVSCIGAVYKSFKRLIKQY